MKMNIAKELVRIARSVERTAGITRKVKLSREQLKDLYDIIPPEEIYGGGILNGNIELKMDVVNENKVYVTGVLFLLVKGDWDEEDEDGNFDTRPRWLRFPLYKGLNFYRVENDDSEFYHWEREDIIGTDSDEKILSLFEEDICYILDSME